MQDPLILFGTLELSTPIAELLALFSTDQWQVESRDGQHHLSKHGTTLTLEGSSSILLRGQSEHNQIEHWDWLPLLRQRPIESYNIDVFEEDGRLIKRLHYNS